MDNNTLENTVYRTLSPDRVLDAVENLGQSCNGRILALNSYENRVYQVGIEDETPVIVKYYRPGRWSNASILEEHAFALELAAEELPVVAPLQTGTTTLHTFQGFRFTKPAQAAKY